MYCYTRSCVHPRGIGGCSVELHHPFSYQGVSFVARSSLWFCKTCADFPSGACVNCAHATESAGVVGFADAKAKFGVMSC